MHEGRPAVAIGGDERDQAFPQGGEGGEVERRVSGRRDGAHGAPPWMTLPTARPYRTRRAPANMRLISRLTAVSSR